jgi:uncharacterized protein YbjT (DUF2867 family)
VAKNNQRVVLVSGATGKQGGAALRHLRDRGLQVRALTRDPNSDKARRLVGHGTEVVRGELDDPPSLTRAMDGVWGVYSVQSHEGEADSELRRGINVADAAKRSRISHFVYSSVANADGKTGIPHFENKFKIEEHIRGTGMSFTILRPVFFMENWLGMRDRIEQGVLALPLRPETTLQMIAVDDIGAFVSMAFEKPGHWKGRTVSLAGDELSMVDLCERIGRAGGREVRYEQVPWDQWEQQVGPEMKRMWQLFDTAAFRVDISALRQEYQALTGFDRWLNMNWARRFAA